MENQSEVAQFDDDEKTQMIEEMRKLWRRNSVVFEAIIDDYKQQGGKIFPPDKKRRKKRRPEVANWVWAEVEFLHWRDGVDVQTACEIIAARGMEFTLYDDTSESPGGIWRPTKEARLANLKPASFKYQAAGGEAGKLSGASIRDIYNKISTTNAAKLILACFKDAHEGKPSVFSIDDMSRLFDYENPNKSDT